MTERMERTAALAEARAMRAAARAHLEGRIRKLARGGKTPTEIQHLLGVSHRIVQRTLSVAGIQPALRPGLSYWAEP